MFDFLMTIYVLRLGDGFFQKATDMPMETKCAQLLSALFLYSYEADILKEFPLKNEK